MTAARAPIRSRMRKFDGSAPRAGGRRRPWSPCRSGLHTPSAGRTTASGPRRRRDARLGRPAAHLHRGCRAGPAGLEPGPDRLRARRQRRVDPAGPGGAPAPYDGSGSCSAPRPAPGARGRWSGPGTSRSSARTSRSRRRPTSATSACRCWPRWPCSRFRWPPRPWPGAFGPSWTGSPSPPRCWSAAGCWCSSPVFRAGSGGRLLEQAILLSYPIGDVVLITIVDLHRAAGAPPRLGALGLAAPGGHRPGGLRGRGLRASAT